MLEQYQLCFIESVRRIVAAHWLLRRPSVRILDMGCNTSGRQLAELARLTRGEVVGINVPEGFPSIEAVQNAGPRVKMFQMDGMNLTFPDKSFDLVISANVIEHVPDPAKFIHEAARVLKDDGVAYLETAPLWTSARGHHVMESMVAENCPEETQFRDDGSVIPEWSHLTLSRDEMELTIGKKVLGPTRDYILRYLYDSRDLNKTPWREIAAACRTAFPHLQLLPRPLPGVDTRLMPTDGADDYSAYGFTAVGRKRPQGWISRRLNWRLRRIGF